MTARESRRPSHVRLAIGDVTPQALRAMDAAVRLAGGLACELDCLFVEDTRLFQAAALPLTREVGAGSARARRLDTPDLAEALQRQAAQARRELERAALGSRIRWSFEVVRGALLTSAMERAAAEDLMVIGAAGLGLDARPTSGLRETLARDGVLALIGAASQGPSAFELVLERALGQRPRRLSSPPAIDERALVEALRRWRSVLLAIDRETLAALAPELARSLSRHGGVVVAGPGDGRR